MTTPSAQPPSRLSWPRKLLFGLGEFGPSVAGGTIIPFYFLFFLTDVAGLRPGVAGTLLLACRLWDAFNDPLVGRWSDRTRSPWGRRRPFLLVGALPMAAFYALLWWVPPLDGATSRAVYYFAVYFLYDLAFTLVSGPYYALTPELTLDSDERTSLISYRMAVSIGSGLVAAIALPFVFDAAPSTETGFLWAGIGIGALAAVPFLLIVAGFRERPEFQARAPDGKSASVGTVLRNRAFWLALTVMAAAWMAIAVVEAVFAYYLVYWVGMVEGDTPLVLATILGSAALFLPVVNALARRFEKKTAFILCALIWAAVHVALWWIPSHTVTPIYIIGFLAGLGVAAAHVVPTAMAVDVLESIEMEGGGRQEGVFGGVSSFIQKLATSLALLAIGWALDLAGYQAGAATQTPATLTVVRSLTSWLPFGLLIVAMLAAQAFPITRDVHRRMSLELERRRAAAAGE
ncbi:MAG TPA: glycoside-pentoside-hexuronide (GPH):cation symporter [Anaerolineales bacterium]|nr:glycoside-pentoside-hexuronide (GPH):cation symporter [Anaerolineales bacterium]